MVRKEENMMSSCIENDLAGYKIRMAYSLNTSQRPIIYKRSKETVVTLSKPLIEKAASFLPECKCEIEEQLMLVREGTNIAFDLELIADPTYDKANEGISLMEEADYDKVCKEGFAFR